MTQNEALQSAKVAGVDAKTARQWLLEVSGASLVDVVLGNVVLTPKQAQRFLEHLEALANGTPLALCAGGCDFYGRRFKVSRATLIPRPDTETLLLVAKGLLVSKMRILELGTGSGILAISLWHLIQDVCITATDASASALEVAQDNAAIYGANVAFVLGDFDDWYAPVSGTFDIILSNPPYIAPHDVHLETLTHEPLNALVAPESGLSDLRAIIQGASKHLRTGGHLLLEHGAKQGVAVRDLLADAGFVQISTHKDMAERERVTGGIWEG